ncbi:MAG: AAA family ATPase [Bacteroidia bacterium]|nr:AAA family ATPase [Bacteroidia bacterium]
MIKDFAKRLIHAELEFTPTADQHILIDKLSEFITDANARILLLVKGYAGTGKTTTVSAFVKTMNKIKQKCILLAPTGRAAKVFSSYSGTNAYTIHKEIYIQKSSSDGFGVFVLSRNLHKNTVFIVDEASMIANQSSELSIFGSGRLLDDLISYVYSGINCRLILVGDTAQLPPVGINLSPALDEKVLQVYNIHVTEILLTEVLRQVEGSGILANATALRRQIETNTIVQPEFKLEKYNDIERLGGADLIETISDSYSKYGTDETIVVCRSNKRANRFNQGIRAQILGRDEEISVGDLLMVVKNNYFWITDNEQINFIANGDIVEVTRIKKYTQRYGFRFADVCIRFVDYRDIEIDAKIILDTLSIELAALSSEENKKLFYAIAEDFATVRSKKKRFEKIRNDPFFNALQVKFAYAVTCHKAQGGQWKSVFVDQGYITREMIDIEYLRWLYTALTRSSEKLYLVNFDKAFFHEPSGA